MEIHHGKHYCKNCDVGFEKRSELLEHNNVQHSNKPFECDICHKVFGERFTLKVHYRVHTGEKPYVCQYCSKSFSQACNLSTHKKRYHFRKLPQATYQRKKIVMHGQIKEVKSEEAKRYPCPHCKIIFRRVEHVKAHILSYHMSRKEFRGVNSRSPSTSSGVSSTSSNSEQVWSPNMTLHCKKCRLTFPERVSYQKHMYAHAKQQEQQMQRHISATQVQVSNSSGQKVNLRELVSAIKQPKEELIKSKSQTEVIQKLSGLGMEISLQPLRKSEGSNELGLVISSVQSVSQSFFDELEKPKETKPRPSFVAEVASRSVLRSNGVNGVPRPQKTESPSASSSNGERDPLELPSATPPLPTLHPQKWKKPKLEPDLPKNNNDDGDIILSSTRRTSRAVAYNEADQPKYISIVTKGKNGKTTKRRIFPCGQCTSKFENIETRKMHFLAVHGSAKAKAERTPPENEPWDTWVN